MKKRVNISDVFILTGLVLIWAGLFFWYGPGPATTISGALTFLLGIATNIKGG